MVPHKLAHPTERNEFAPIGLQTVAVPAELFQRTSCFTVLQVVVLSRGGNSEARTEGAFKTTFQRLHVRLIRHIQRSTIHQHILSNN